jgi:hypothetical protein
MNGRTAFPTAMMTVATSVHWVFVSILVVINFDLFGLESGLDFLNYFLNFLEECFFLGG